MCNKKNVDIKMFKNFTSVATKALFSQKNCFKNVPFCKEKADIFPYKNVVKQAIVNKDAVRHNKGNNYVTYLIVQDKNVEISDVENYIASLCSRNGLVQGYEKIQLPDDLNLNASEEGKYKYSRSVGFVYDVLKRMYKEKNETLPPYSDLIDLFPDSSCGKLVITVSSKQPYENIVACDDYNLVNTITFRPNYDEKKHTDKYLNLMYIMRSGEKTYKTSERSGIFCIG